MKLSIAIAQGRWEIAAHLVVIGLVRASRRSGKRNHTVTNPPPGRKLLQETRSAKYEILNV